MGTTVARAAAGSERFRRVVVVGLDGLDPGLVTSLLARGELPNLARMRDAGGLTTVATTTPAQTPVAWSTFATGLNPGGHGIFDFLRRDPATYLPDLALNRYERRNAFTPPKAVNLRQGVPVWERLGRAGVASAVVRCPCTYPPDPMAHGGRMLSGMGVPDLRGGLGSGTYYTTRDGATAGEGERVERLRPDGAGFAASFIGPRGAKSQDLTAAFRLEAIDRSAGTALLVCDDASPARIDLRSDAWSGWVHLKIRAGLLQAVRGMVRLRLVETGDHLGLYASPLNFDPESPLFPISSPTPFAGELAADLGPYYTTGMVEDHAALSNGRIDESAFLDQCREVWDEREAMLLRELESSRDGLVYALFDTPDRVQHLFWRHTEPDHPANRGRTTGPEWARVVEDQYRRSDAVLGFVLDQANDGETLLIAMSDHGFGSFRRCIDLNGWLLQNGLLKLADGREPGTSAGDMLRGIDWSGTRAYAVGLGGIYLNLAGREAGGIVRADEAEAVRNQIIDGLTGLPDPEASGAVAVRSVRRREDVYRGPCVGEAPDLVVNTARGWRIGWSTSLGGVDSVVFRDNTHAWAGDHIVDPAQVPGVLVMNRPFREAGASLIDLAPTILRALGVPEGTDLEGSSLR
jgi:predicted AlkP superfamily phosphohydrolase/phosphomutase